MGTVTKLLKTLEMFPVLGTKDLNDIEDTRKEIIKLIFLLNMKEKGTKAKAGIRYAVA